MSCYRCSPELKQILQNTLPDFNSFAGEEPLTDIFSNDNLILGFINYSADSLLSNPIALELYPDLERQMSFLLHNFRAGVKELLSVYLKINQRDNREFAYNYLLVNSPNEDTAFACYQKINTALAETDGSAAHNSFEEHDEIFLLELANLLVANNPDLLLKIMLEPQWRANIHFQNFINEDLPAIFINGLANTPQKCSAAGYDFLLACAKNKKFTPSQEDKLLRIFLTKKPEQVEEFVQLLAQKGKISFLSAATGKLLLNSPAQELGLKTVQQYLESTFHQETSLNVFDLNKRRLWIKDFFCLTADFLAANAALPPEKRRKISFNLIDSISTSPHKKYGQKIITLLQNLQTTKPPKIDWSNLIDTFDNNIPASYHFDFFIPLLKLLPPPNEDQTAEIIRWDQRKLFGNTTRSLLLFALQTKNKKLVDHCLQRKNLLLDEDSSIGDHCLVDDLAVQYFSLNENNQKAEKEKFYRHFFFSIQSDPFGIKEKMFVLGQDFPTFFIQDFSQKNKMERRKMIHDLCYIHNDAQSQKKLVALTIKKMIQKNTIKKVPAIYRTILLRAFVELVSDLKHPVAKAALNGQGWQFPQKS